jgi:RNA polymerase sigma-70 factor (ECF subfamily)
MAPERGPCRRPDGGFSGRIRGEVELAAATPQEGIGALGDDEVVSRARAGDQEAWGIVYDRLHRPLLGYLRVRACPDPENALGEVFLRLARSLGRFTGGMAELRAYAFTVAQNYLRDLARARKARLAITFLAPDALADAGEGPPAASAEDDALGSLSLWSLRAAFAELTF